MASYTHFDGVMVNAQDNIIHTLVLKYTQCINISSIYSMVPNVEKPAFNRFTEQIPFKVILFLAYILCQLN